LLALNVNGNLMVENIGGVHRHVNWYREIDRNLKEEIEKIEKLIPAEIR